MDLEECILQLQLNTYMMVLKISPNLKGYSYLVDGAFKIIKDMTKKHNVNKRLYAELAEEYNVDKDLIDRAMRHCIIASKRKNGLEDFEKYSRFEFSCEKPTPRELLCVLAEKATLDRNRFLKEYSTPKRLSYIHGFEE